MGKLKEKRIYLEGLPRAKNKKCIDWKNCIGKKVKFYYDGINGEFEIIEYTSRSKVLIEYNEKTFEISTDGIINCRLGKITGVITGDFKIEVGDVFKDEKRNLKILDREYRADKMGHKTKWYKLKCNKCGWEEGWKLEGDILNGGGCSCCSHKILVENINSMYATDYWMIDRFGISVVDAKTNYSTANRRIIVKCPDCGRELERNIYDIHRYKTIKCPCNSDGFSYPEKFMMSALEQLNIEYKTQYTTDYLVKEENGRKSRKFSDFYLPYYNLIIETDGGLGHKNGVLHKSATKTLEELVAIDNWKDEQHLKNGVKTIRIDCFESKLEYIKNNILSSKLNDIFDLSKIDWLKCEEFALKNIVKEICDYWNIRSNNEQTKDLERKFGIDQTTITRYLKKGTELGWCEYNPKEEMRKSQKRAKEFTTNTVEIFKSGKSLGLFSGCYELARKSEELFGVKMTPSGIQQACKGTVKMYKGFAFRYANEEGSMEKMLERIKTHEPLVRKVEVSKDGRVLGVYNGCLDLERRSEAELGVKLLNACISSVCRGKQSHHKGYTFRYIEN